MKLSELTPEIAATHVRTAVDDSVLPIYLDGARYHVLSYTGLTMEQADEKDDLAVAALILTADMYDNRQATVESDKVNRVLDSLLSVHRVNLL